MTTSLVIRGAEATTVFSLFGGDEDAATYALGWTLRRSDALLGALLVRLGSVTEIRTTFRGFQSSLSLNSAKERPFDRRWLRTKRRGASCSR